MKKLMVEEQCEFCKSTKIEPRSYGNGGDPPTYTCTKCGATCDLNCDLSCWEWKMRFSTLQAKEAIAARINGIWDNPQLKKLGALSANRLTDINRIIDMML